MTCGAGRDRATADEQDVVAADCEELKVGTDLVRSLTPSAQLDQPRLQLHPSGRVRTKLRCGGATRGGCRILASFKTLGTPSRSLGSLAVKLVPGQSATRNLRLSRLLRRVVRRRGQITVQLTLRVTDDFGSFARTTRKVKLRTIGRR